MQMNEIAINEIANNNSNIIINKILQNEINIQDGLNSVTRTLMMIIGKTLPDDEIKKLSDRAIELSTIMTDVLINLDDKYSVAEIALAFNAIMEYFINK